MREIMILISVAFLACYGAVKLLPVAVAKTEVAMIRAHEKQDLDEVKNRVERMKQINASR